MFIPVASDATATMSDSSPAGIEDVFAKLPDDEGTTTLASTTSAEASTTMEDAFSKYASYGSSISEDSRESEMDTSVSTTSTTLGADDANQLGAESDSSDGAVATTTEPTTVA